MPVRNNLSLSFLLMTRNSCCNKCKYSFGHNKDKFLKGNVLRHCSRGRRKMQNHVCPPCTSGVGDRAAGRTPGDSPPERRPRRTAPRPPLLFRVGPLALHLCNSTVRTNENMRSSPACPSALGGSQVAITLKYIPSFYSPVEA